MTEAIQSSHHGALAKYDPETGLKTIAVLEGAEKHYARAKDATKLQIAIRNKLEAQAEFVLWWDTHGPGAIGPGQPRKNGPSTATILPKAGKRGLPDKQVVFRWRRNLNPDNFETTYAKVVAHYTKIVEFQKMAHVGYNSGECEWYTPPDIVEAARQVLGEIDLDPATSLVANDVIKAAQIFTLQDSGLKAPWHGRVWMNPPYGPPLITQFCEKLARHIRDGDISAAVVLVNNATETEWFRTIASMAIAVCFPSGRIPFWATGITMFPLQGQAVLYIGPHRERFLEAFQGFGLVWVKPSNP